MAEAEPKPIVAGTYYGQHSPLGQWMWNGTGRADDAWQKVLYYDSGQAYNVGSIMANDETSVPAAASPPASVAPAAITPGTAILGTATIASLFTALWANQVAGPNAGTLAYRWSDPFTIQAYYADGSIMMFHGEARACGGTTIALS